MKYKGYTATIEWAEEEDAFHGRVANITDVVNFYGRSVDELRREMATSVEIYLILYRAGLVGAALSLLYAVDVIWVHASGRSLLPIPGRFVSREGMLTAIAIGLMLALLSWGTGTAARYLVNKLAEK